MTNIFRANTVIVQIDGVQLSGQYRALSFTASYGYDQRTAQATVRVKLLDPGKPAPKPLLSKVYISAGASQINVRFFGLLVEIDPTLWPQSLDLICRGPLVRAEKFTCTSSGGLALAGTGSGDTDQNMVRNVLQAVGLTTGDYTPGGGDPPKGPLQFPVLIGGSDATHPTAYSGSGTGRTLGVTNSSQFVWAEGETALSFIERIEEVGLGYRTFESKAGQIVRQIVDPFADTASAATFTEGVDIFQVTGQQTILTAENRVNVTGYNPGGAGVLPKNTTVQQANPLLVAPDGSQLYVTHQTSSQLIERSLNADAGTGLSCQEVGTWVLRQNNRYLYKFTLTTHRDDQLSPGQTITVNAPHIGTSQNFYLQNVQPGVDEQGAFTQTLIGLSSVGPQGPVTLSPGVDFTMQLEVESVVVGAADTLLYTVHCVPVIVGNSAIASYAWSTGGAGIPSTGTGDTFTTTFTSAAGAVTLAITDSSGLGGTTTKQIPPATGNDYLTRKLYLAGTTTADDYVNGTTWNVHAQTAATVVANAPLWADGANVLASSDDLATAPTSSTPFASGTVTALWCETDVSTSTYLAGSSLGHVAFATGGGTWSDKGAVPDGNPILKCLISRAVPGQWFALTAANLYRTDNSGSGWVVVQTAAGGETFTDWVISVTRGMITMTGGRKIIDLAGTTQTGTFTGNLIAVTSDIRADRFYVYADDGTTYGHVNAGDTALVALTALNLYGGTAQPRGLWRDGDKRGLLYYAAGSGGVGKSLDGFGSSAGYKQSRKPGVGTSPGGAIYKQVGANGLLFQAPVAAPTAPVVVVSSTSAKALSLWNGSSNNAPPAGWSDVTFNDTGWGAAVVAVTDGQTLPTGSAPIWSSNLPVSTTEQILLRHSFTLSAGVLSSAILTFMRDDGTEGIWVNGMYLSGSRLPWASSFGPFTFTIPANILRTGTNMLALWGDTSVPIHAWMAYRLEVS